MHITKLWNALCEMDVQYTSVISKIIGNLIQEIIDGQSFQQSGPHDIDFIEALDEFKSVTDSNAANMMFNCAVEFCVTNKYPLVQESNKEWNCIEHLLSLHGKLFSKSEKEYLNALNNSYMGIYKVSAVIPNKFIVLQDMIEDLNPAINAAYKDFDKSSSQKLKVGQIVATRLLENTSKTDIRHEFSSTVLFLPPEAAENAIEIITALSDRVFKYFPEDPLIVKKMWLKEIVEQWYLFCSSNKIAYS